MTIFDIKKPPLTTHELAESRKILSDRLQHLSLRAKQITYLRYSIGLIGACAVLALWQLGVIAGSQAVAMGVSIVAGVSIMVAASVVIFGIQGVVTDADTVAAMGAGMMVAAGIIAFTATATATDALALAATVVGVFSGTIVMPLLYKKYIYAPIRATNEELKSLVELDASKTPNKCISFAAWCEADKTIAELQHALVAIGRNPVMGEYKAAKNWIENAGRRQANETLLADAREACEQMKKPIQVLE